MVHFSLFQHIDRFIPHPCTLIHLRHSHKRIIVSENDMVEVVSWDGEDTGRWVGWSGDGAINGLTVDRICNGREVIHGVDGLSTEFIVDAFRDGHEAVNLVLVALRFGRRDLSRDEKVEVAE